MDTNVPIFLASFKFGLIRPIRRVSSISLIITVGKIENTLQFSSILFLFADFPYLYIFLEIQFFLPPAKFFASHFSDSEKRRFFSTTKNI